jgi:hypothetical protein
VSSGGRPSPLDWLAGLAYSFRRDDSAPKAGGPPRVSCRVRAFHAILLPPRRQLALTMKEPPMEMPPNPTRRLLGFESALRTLAWTTCSGALLSCCSPACPPCAAQPAPPCAAEPGPPPANQPGAQPATQPTTQTTPARAPQNPGDCHKLVAQAVDELEKVERANKSCARDADCVVVDREARCFDSCSTVISVAGLSAYEQAKQRANQGPCAEFASQGCTPNAPPPCSPPSRPRCVAGSCGWYLPEG